MCHLKTQICLSGITSSPFQCRLGEKAFAETRTHLSKDSVIWKDDFVSLVLGAAGLVYDLYLLSCLSRCSSSCMNSAAVLVKWMRAKSGFATRRLVRLAMRAFLGQYLREM